MIVSNKTFMRKISIGLISVIITMLTTDCKKENSSDVVTATIPVITTTNVSLITQTTAKSGGNITSNNSGFALSSGICWSTSPNPTIALATKTAENKGTGEFISDLTALQLNTTYYVRAYASNSAGTGYGNQVTFKTKASIYEGQSYGGGIIFYVDGTGLHGLIAATGNINTLTDKTSWSNNINLVTNATSLTDGFANTQLIINAQGNTGIYAAKLCKDYRGGGFSDWFLPSVNQLQTLYSKRDVNYPPGGPTDSFLASFTTGAYWTSTENTKDSAFIINFSGGQSASYSKESKNTTQFPLVRCIRAF